MYTEIHSLRETKISELKIDWGSRAVKYEEKICSLGEDGLTKLCWMKKCRENSQIGYWKDGESIFNRLGFSEVEIEVMKNSEVLVHEKMQTRYRDTEKQV